CPRNNEVDSVPAPHTKSRGNVAARATAIPRRWFRKVGSRPATAVVAQPGATFAASPNSSAARATGGSHADTNPAWPAVPPFLRLRSTAAPSPAQPAHQARIRPADKVREVAVL